MLDRRKGFRVTKTFLVTVLIGALALTGALLLARHQPTAAQPPADTMRALLTELNANNTQATIAFGQAVPRLGRSIDMGEGGAQFERIGADMVCFIVPGTTVDQIGCVPYTNITSVIYSENR
jgi:hypothetical protein